MSVAVWASGDYSNKIKLQKIIFPEGFYYNKKNDQPRTTKMNSIFQLIASLKSNTEQNKTETFELILRNSGWVAPVEQFSNNFSNDLALLLRLTE